MTPEEVVMERLKKVETAEGFAAACELATAIRGMICAAGGEEHRINATILGMRLDVSRAATARLRGDFAAVVDAFTAPGDNPGARVVRAG